MPTWTQSEIDALRAKIAAGVKSVAYADKSLVNHDLEQQVALLERMETDNANAAGTSNGRSTLASTSRA